MVDPKVLQIINSLRINISKKRTIFEKISLLVFIWFFLLFILNLQYTLTNSYDENIFLFTIIILFCVVIYQIFFSKINAVIMIFEIFLIYLSLLLLYNVGYSGLRDSDAYLDYNFLKIIWGGHFTLGNDPAGVKGWPILHIFSAINSQLTNISPLLIAKYLPSFISSIIILPIYLLIYEVHNNKKVALFSCLIFGSVPQFITFVSDFVRETIGLFFMILFLYILYLSKKRDNYRLIFLALLLIPIIIFSHHLTSFLTIVLLGMYILVSIVIPYLYRIDKQIQLSGKINILIIFLILSLGVITYWVWSANIIVQVFEKTFTTKAEVTTSYAARINLGASILTLKGYIIYYGFYFFYFLFALLLLIKFIFKKNKQIIEDISFGFFFLFCMFLGFISLYFIKDIGFPDRFIPFGLMFGLIPLVGILVFFKKDRYKKIIALFLVFFIFYNIYSIDPAYLSGDVNSPGVNAGDKEYTIAQTIQFPSLYYGYSALVGAIYDVQGIAQRTNGKVVENLNISAVRQNSDTIIINLGTYLFNTNSLEAAKKKGLASYNLKMEILSLKNQFYINKICDLGDVYIVQAKG